MFGILFSLKNISWRIEWTKSTCNISSFLPQLKDIHVELIGDSSWRGCEWFCVNAIDWRPVRGVPRLLLIVHSDKHQIWCTDLYSYDPRTKSRSNQFFFVWALLPRSMAIIKWVIYKASQVDPHHSLLVAFNGEWKSFYCTARSRGWGYATPIVWHHISAKRLSSEPLAWRRQGHDYVLCRVDLVCRHSALHTKGLVNDYLWTPI